MRFDILTIFPGFFDSPLSYGVLKRAIVSGQVSVATHDLRNFTRDRHRTVDDRPFGGGEGMVLKPEPLFEAVESVLGGAAAGPSSSTSSTAVVLLSASGKLFRQATAQRFAALDRVVLLCGRYEGVDERVAEHLATEELSIGDFVLSGGELAAALVIDAVTRLLPGALGNETSPVHESFSGDTGGVGRISAALQVVEDAAQAAIAHGAAPLLLDWPHYTRPADFREWAVPEVLLSGNHEEIRRWRLRPALEKTRRNGAA